MRRLALSLLFVGAFVLAIPAGCTPVAFKPGELLFGGLIGTDVWKVSPDGLASFADYQNFGNSGKENFGQIVFTGDLSAAYMTVSSSPHGLLRIGADGKVTSVLGSITDRSFNGVTEVNGRLFVAAVNKMEIMEVRNVNGKSVLASVYKAPGGTYPAYRGLAAAPDGSGFYAVDGNNTSGRVIKLTIQPDGSLQAKPVMNVLDAWDIQVFDGYLYVTAGPQGQRRVVRTRLDGQNREDMTGRNFYGLAVVGEKLLASERSGSSETKIWDITEFTNAKPWAVVASSSWTLFEGVPGKIPVPQDAPSAVPEPATLVLAGTALLGFAWRARRYRRA